MTDKERILWVQNLEPLHKEYEKFISTRAVSITDYVESNRKRIDSYVSGILTSGGKFTAWKK